MDKVVSGYGRMSNGNIDDGKRWEEGEKHGEQSQCAMGKTIRQEERFQFASNSARSSQNADASGDKRSFVATSTSIAYDSKQVRPQKFTFPISCRKHLYNR